MQGATRVGGQANDVASVRRDFWLDENDVKHAAIVVQDTVIDGYLR